MNKDGKVVIGAELETKNFENKLTKLEERLKFWQRRVEYLQKDLETEANPTFGFAEGHKKSISEAIEQINLYQQAIENLKNPHKELEQVPTNLEEIRKGFENINNEQKNTQLSIEKIGSSITGVVKKIGRWAIALFGIRSVYSFIRTSMSTLSQYNEQLATDVEYIRYALAKNLQPIIEGIIKLVYQLLGLVNSLAKALFGVDLFANASAKSFGKANKSASELKKTLAGFDKINVLNENGSTSALGGSFAPSFDLSQDNLFDKWDLTKFIDKGKQIAKNIAEGINNFFRNTNWSVLGQSVGDALIGIVDIIITFIREVDWKLIGESIADFLLSVDWIGLAVKIFELLIEAMIASMYLMEGVTEKIIEKLTDPEFLDNLAKSGNKMIEKIADGASNVNESLERVWSKIISFFLKKLGIKDSDAEKVGEKIGEGIHYGLDVALEHLPFFGTFYKVIKYAKQAFGIHSPSKEFADIGINLMEGLKNGIKSGINGVIDIINIMIDKINGALAFKWNKIEIAGIKLLDAGSVNVGRIPRIPRLAAGGIVNMPGRGVDYYGANIGERRPEGIVPLDNKQSLETIGRTIAKYASFNADITLEIENRVLTRVQKELNADRQFARNGG